ncbi:MAG: hypothetical protein JKY30_14945, partial [Flavobacteriales bacterium]|nr:hypothetical protein [Flavobacteriales bacterium]
MASQLKKYGLFVILIGLSFSSYWFFYRSHWGVSINKEHRWKYSFQPKSVISFNTIDWKNSKEKQTISEEQKTSNLIFQTEFNLKDYTKIQEGFLEFEYKNSVKVLINGLKCTSIERNLITSSLEGNHIRIEEYWRPRKLILTQEMLSSSLKNGKNSITIIVTNVEDIKTVESSKKQLSFLTKCQGNHLETNFKIQKPPRYFSESNL